MLVVSALICPMAQQIPCDGMQTALACHSDLSIRRVYSASCDGQLHVWNMNDLTCTKTFFQKGSASCTDMVVIDVMDQLASSFLDGKIHIIDLHVGQVAKTLSGRHHGVTLLRYVGENGYLLSGGVDQNIHVWNPHVETKIGSLIGHNQQLLGVDVVPNTSQIVSADEGGTIKIWDLRKFSALQTISRDAYIKGTSTQRTRSRPMTAFCYLSSKYRIAIAHSTMYFLDKATHDEFDDDVTSGLGGDNARMDNIPSYQRQSDGGRSSIMPVAVLFIAPSQTLIAITTNRILSWAASTGRMTNCSSIDLKSNITCAVLVDDHRSCFVGMENGSIARLVVPGGGVLAQRKICDAEVTAVKWTATIRYVAACLVDGNIAVVKSDTLEVLHTLNHWRGVQSVLSRLPLAQNDDESGEHKWKTSDLHAPARLRAFFQTSELEWAKHLFISARPAASGMVSRSRAVEVLQTAFPHLSEDDKNMSDNAQLAANRTLCTFAEFLQEMKRMMENVQGGKVFEYLRHQLELSCIDVHSGSHQMVSGSISNDGFCVWNLRNGSVITAGTAFSNRADEVDVPTKSSLTHALFLQPLPYLALVDGSRSMLSIWSTDARSFAVPHPYQRIVEVQHSKQDNTDSSQFVSVVEWHYDGDTGEKLLILGDDQGINILLFKPLTLELIFTYGMLPSDLRFSQCVRLWSCGQDCPTKHKLLVVSTSRMPRHRYKCKLALTESAQRRPQLAN